MDRNYHWNSDNKKKNKFLLEIVIENFKKHTPGYDRFLQKNKKILLKELLNLTFFFSQLYHSHLNQENLHQFLINVKDDHGKSFISDKNAKLIIKNLFIPTQKGGNYQYRVGKKYYKLKKRVIQYGGIEDNYSANIMDNLQRFKNELTNPQQESSSLIPYTPVSGNDNPISLFNLPMLLQPYLTQEFQKKLNINDILLIGFSVFPTIGWIFDIFLILRSLIEKRYVLAILLTINCYQYLFYKLISFGFLGMNFGNLIKIFYLAPYASKDFNLENLKLKFRDFTDNISTSFDKEYLFT